MHTPLLTPDFDGQPSTELWQGQQYAIEEMNADTATIIHIPSGAKTKTPLVALKDLIEAHRDEFLSGYLLDTYLSDMRISELIGARSC